MSLFRKPKKIQRRVFSSTLDEEDENAADAMEVEIDGEQSVQNNKKSKDGGTKKSSNKTEKVEEPKSKALLSFADDEEDTEVFQVRKSSNSKKIMRMLDRERRRKRKEERHNTQSTVDGEYSGGGDGGVSIGRQRERQSYEHYENGKSTNGSSNNSHNLGSTTTSSNKYKGTTALATSGKSLGTASATAVEQCKSKKSDSIQTEIRTDDFVVRLLLSISLHVFCIKKLQIPNKENMNLQMLFSRNALLHILHGGVFVVALIRMRKKRRNHVVVADKNNILDFVRHSNV
uniref:Uncharacterized protein n=1 Tax=Zeugodacus cucurbitae TaxID=28588 RepID=A0A0A1X669_ZEUCU